MLETQYGTFNRTFYLPDNVNPDKIKARMENGILMVTVPKDEQKTMKRQIDISSEGEQSEATTIKSKNTKD